MEITVKLKQHTPIFHFQHDQKGAALRATELKPKLDEYLGKNKEERIPYQLKIKPLERYERKEPHKLYFGNQGDNVKKQTLFHAQGVELTINTYFDEKLLKKIKEKLPICFALENFGTRQNKGFGSFYPDDSYNNEKNKEWFKDIETVLKQCSKPVYYFDVKEGNPLDYINALYKAMKSGINETFGKKESKAYLKSLLWQYLNKGRTKGNYITWEKRFMKQALSGRIIKDSQYFKALLGICEEYPFRKANNARMDNDYGDIRTFNLRYDAKFKISSSEIDRFKSPITFKPIGKRVYIILEDTYESEGINLKGSSFHFECGDKEGDLKVPDKFSLKNFMDFVMAKVNAGFKDFEGKSASILNRITIQELQIRPDINVRAKS